MKHKSSTGILTLMPSQLYAAHFTMCAWRSEIHAKPSNKTVIVCCIIAHIRCLKGAFVNYLFVVHCLFWLYSLVIHCVFDVEKKSHIASGHLCIFYNINYLMTGGKFDRSKSIHALALELRVPFPPSFILDCHEIAGQLWPSVLPIRSLIYLSKVSLMVPPSVLR